MALVVGREDSDFVRVVAEAGSRVAQGVEDDEVEALACELAPRVFQLVVRLEGEADEALFRILLLEQTTGR